MNGKILDPSFSKLKCMLAFICPLVVFLSFRLFVKLVGAEQGKKSCGVEVGKAKCIFLGCGEGAGFD
jgi:hypothetical protein